MDRPTLPDITAAKDRVYAHMRASPLLRHPLLDEWLGRPAWVKHENHNPTGSFKIRGGLNLVAQLSDEEKLRGVISASTGNHGQSVALACRIHGVRCRVVVPVGNNPDKNAAMRVLGAELVEYGRDFDEAREFVEEMAVREGWRYVHSANEPHLIAGVATYALEVFEALPDVDYIVVPIGGGSGAAGCAIVRSAIGSRAKVIGVQAARADAFTRSWRGTTRVTARAETFAEGLATGTTYDLTFSILKAELDDVVTLEESDLDAGLSAALRCTHNLAEGAGVAAIAGARKAGLPEHARIVCVMTGGNADARTLRRVLA
ncbi:MAG TPA: threonine dehydratase [Vicinamibacterales bacterium]|nr:threonine dehydratase [Vicinamibacterales bacterium]